MAALPKNIFYVWVRDKWATYRSDNMGAYVHAPGAQPVDAQDLLWFAYSLPVAQGGYAGAPNPEDLVLAYIIDDARNKGVLRPQFAGAV